MNSIGTAQKYSRAIKPRTGKEKVIPLNRLHSQLFYFEKVTMISSEDEIKNHLGSSIIYTGRMISNLINNYFTSIGTNITFEQMSVLFFIVLSTDKEIIQQDLASMMNKNKSAVLRTIDILEKKGYVKRQPVPNDRRKNIIEATPTGVKIVKNTVKISHKFEKEYTKKLTPRDIKTCMKVLQVLRGECSNGITKI